MAASEGAKGGNKMGCCEGAKDTGKSTKHAHEYPGRAIPAKGKARDAKADSGAQASGMTNSIGTSASGSHKGLKK